MNPLPLNGQAIVVEVRNVYGNQNIYPLCDNARAFAKLTGKKTLSHADLITIGALGFGLNVKQPVFKI